MKYDEDVLLNVVRLLGCATHAAYVSNLHGGEWSKHAKFNEFKPGDMVMEISTFYMAFADPPRHCSPLDAIGILEVDTREPMPMSEWDETVDGPVPTERIFYIRTFDGRQYRWSNASMIRVPDDPRFIK